MKRQSKWKLIAQVGMTALVAGGGAMLAAPASAQTAPRQISIPAQPLAEALRELGRQAGTQVIFEEVIVRDRTSAPVNTSAGPEEAIRQMLSGSGLVVRRGDSGVYIIAVGSGSSNSGGSGISNTSGTGEAAPVEIVVTGTRASVQNSLSQQRAKDNVATVLSSDISGKFPDSTLAETMRRAPGVSFQRSERGGEGEFISIRGLDAGLNNVQINGVNAGTASGGRDRRVPLDVFQAGTVSEIVINKSLLPEHESTGIGGAVELNTRNPLTIKRSAFNVKLEGRYGEFADKLGYSVSGSYNTKFGDADQFGISLAGSYRSREIQSFVYDVLGDWVPAQIPITPDPDGTGTIDRVDLAEFQAAYGDDFTASSFPSGDDLRVEDVRSSKYDLTRDNLSLTGAFGWDISDSTRMLLSATYAESEETNNRSAMGFEQSDRYDRDTDPANFYGRSPFVRIRSETEDENETSGNVVLKFDTHTDRWHFTYGGGWAFATSEIPFSVEVDFELPDLDEDDPLGTGALAPEIAPTGRRFIDFDLTGNVPVPLLTDAGWAALRNPANLVLDGVQVFTERERNDRYSVFFDASHDIDDDFIRGLKFGAKIERSDFESIEQDLYDDIELAADGTAGDGEFSLADTNLLDGTTSDTANHGSPMGPNLFFYGFNRDALLAFGNNAVASLAPDTVLSMGQLNTREEIFSAYGQLYAETGDWQFIYGWRLEHVEVSSSDVFTNDEDIVDEGGAPIITNEVSGSYSTLLPRLQINYRPQNDLVFRGAFFTSIARPSPDDMGELRVRFDDRIIEDPDNPGQTIDEDALIVTLPNPGLKPAYSWNFDLGAEWYFSKSGVLSANLFYKKIDNFIYNGITRSGNSNLSVAGLNNIPGFENVDFTEFDAVEIRQVDNGDIATVYGVEFNFNAQLDDYIDEWYGGFGLLANLTLQHSDTIIPITEDYSREVRFFNSPNYIGNIALTYEKYGLDASLSYSFQDRQLDSVEAFLNLDEWEQPYDSLDFRVEYKLPFEDAGSWKIFMRVSDITNGGSRPINWETKGTGTRYLDDIEYIGREWRFGIKGRF